jgi:hypothetical protein
MSHRLDFRPQALTDIAEGAVWYEERQPGFHFSLKPSHFLPLARYS